MQREWRCPPSITRLFQPRCDATGCKTLTNSLNSSAVANVPGACLLFAKSIVIAAGRPGCTFTETEILVGLLVGLVLVLSLSLAWLVSVVDPSRINLRLFSLKDGES